MQFVGRADKAKSRRSRRVLLNYYQADTYYPHSLSMYKDPPSYDVTLQEFEAYAFERVKVLYYLDSLSSSYNKNSQQYSEKLTEFLKKNYAGFLLTTSVDRDPNEAEIEWRKRDHISHFILRLAYCRSEELRHWFLEKELDLFKFRFSRETVASAQEFLKQNNFTYNPITTEEKRELADCLASATPDITRSEVDSTHFYKVQFTEVLNLVISRRVFLSEGFAFVPQKEFVYIISQRFREHLSKSLTLTFRSLPQLEEKERILPILKAFSKEAVAAAYDPKKNEGNINIAELDQLSKKSYPLCMRQLHKQLKDVHHLRHWGRMQYGLYLKGMGVTLQDSLKFWRQEFTKAMDVDKFEKQYSYNIRFNYGKEGKRTNYSPWNCMKIITKNAPQSEQEHHGCPFKHCSEGILRQRLTSYKTPKDAIDEIIDLVKKNHFQIACQKYFAVTHGLDDHTAFPVTHPNSYFDESQRLLGGGKPANAKKDTTSKDEFVPNWQQTPNKTAAPTPKKQKIENDDWDDDSAIEQLMMDCTETAE